MNCFQIVLIALLVSGFLGFVGVMSMECVEQCIGTLLGLSDKNAILRFLGFSMGGILIALQALMSYKRAKAMEKAAKAQADSNLHTETGHRQERLKNAIEHLGNESDSVRLGGAYELLHLARNTKKYRKTVLEILCAHIRSKTGEEKYQQAHESKPSEEIQSLLTLLFVQEKEIFMGIHANLQGSFLNGAFLSRANLNNALLNSAKMRNTVSDFIRESIGQESDLSGITPMEGGVESFVKDSGAITGSYSKEDAEKWITEYERTNLKKPMTGAQKGEQS